MKRKFLAFLLAFVMVVGMLPMAALAAGEGDTGTGTGTDTGTLQSQINAEGTDPVDITLSTEKTESITIKSGKTVNLTIEAGGKLTNSDGKDTITVEAGGTLTVTGAGTVDNVSHGKAALNNAGTATLTGTLTFTRSQEKGTYGEIDKTTNKRVGYQANGNSWYTIYNTGELTINGPTVTTGMDDVKVGEKTYKAGGYSSLINNTASAAKLAITTGTFNGGVNTVKNNDGALQISGGDFTNTSQSVILNWDTSEDNFIEGGTFTYTGDENYPVIMVGKSGGVTDSKLAIKGGSFTAKTNGQKIIDKYPTGNYKGGIATVTGGTFNVDPSEYVPETHMATKNDTTNVWTVAVKAPEAKPTLAFANSADTEEFFGKTAANMGSFTFAEPMPVTGEDGTFTVKVTGSANYVDSYTGWSVASEEEGHYLPIKITSTPNSLAKVTTYNKTVGAKDGKEIALTSGVENVAFFLDGTENVTGLAANTIKVVAGAKDATGANTYIIDFSELTLLPKPVQNEDGSTTESKVDPEDENTVVTETTTSDGEVIGSVGLPADTEGLGGMTVEVKAVESSALPQAIQDSNSKVAAALKETSTKLVEVTVKMVDENGDEQEQFTSDAALAKADIVITIGGLEGGKTYYVFSIDNAGKVTSYGYKELGADESSIQVSSKHLTILAAAEVDTAEDGTGLKASDVQGDTNVDKTDETTSGLTQSDGTPPTPATGNTTWDSTEKVGVGDGTVTITGLTNNGAYVVGIEYSGAKVYANVTATGTTLKIGCQKGAKVTLTDNSSNPVNLNGASEYTVPTT